MPSAPVLQTGSPDLACGLLLLVLAALAALAVPALGDALARARRTGRGTRAAVIAVTLLALALRVSFDPFRPVVFTDEWEYVDVARSLLVDHVGMLCVDGDAGGCARFVATEHPLGHPVVLALAGLAAGPAWGTAAHLSLALGVLTVPLLFAAGLFLLDDEGSALAAAALLAILPLHARYSTAGASEATSIFFLALSLLLAGVHLAGRSRRAPWATALALAFSALVRWENLLFLPPLGALLLRRDGTRAAAPLLLVLALTLPVSPLPDVRFGGTTDQNVASLARLWAGDGHHSPVLALLAALGLASRDPRRLALGAVFASFLVLLAAHQGIVDENDTDRHMLPPYLPFLLLAGSGLVSLLRLGRPAAILAAAAVIAQTVPLIGPCPACERPGSLEPGFAAAARSALPPGCLVATLRPHVVHVLWDHPAVHVGFLDSVSRAVAAGRCVALDRSPECDAAGLSVACDHLANEYRSRTIASQALPDGRERRLVILEPREDAGRKDLAGVGLREIEVLERGCGAATPVATLSGGAGVVTATASLDVPEDCFTAAAVVETGGDALDISLAPERERRCRATCAAHLVARVTLDVGGRSGRARLLVGGRVLAEADLG